jgi:hypothetical protein
MRAPDESKKPTSTISPKAKMDQAKALRDDSLKTFEKSFYLNAKLYGRVVGAPKKPFLAEASTYNKNLLEFTFNDADKPSLKSSYGIAWGFKNDKFNGPGYYTKDAFDRLTRTNPRAAKGGTSGGGIRLGKMTDKFYKDYLAYQTAEKLYQKYKKAYDKTVKTTTTTGGGGSKTTKTPPATPTTYAYGDTTLKYNLGAVNDMYFSPSSTAGGMRIAGGNQPVKRVRNAQELWTDKSFTDDGTSLVDNGYKSAYKGMIQSYSVSAAKTTTGGTASEAEKNKTLNPYKMGFQFHYNPSRIGTTWAGVLNVDPGYIASGKSKFGPVGAQSGTGSGVTITIPLNRLSDMKYVNTSESKWSEMPWRELYGVSIKEQPDGKESQSPTFEDLRKIRDLGTMYDVEFLLQTIVGYRQKSYIRQNRHALTADLGYLGGLPVELHLGKNMRYFVTVTSISVNHSIFTKDMIPTLSELTFTCSRLPDYITN